MSPSNHTLITHLEWLNFSTLEHCMFRFSPFPFPLTLSAPLCYTNENVYRTYDFIVRRY